LRASYSDRLISIQPSGGGLDVVAVNDSDQPWSGSLLLSRRAWDGQLLAEKVLSAMAAPRSVWRAAVPIGVRSAGDPVDELIVAQMPGAARGFWYFAEDVERLPPATGPGYRATVRQVEGGYQVEITAETVLRDLTLLVDRAHPDAAVDDMLITLLPGEVAAVAVRSPVLDDPAVLTRAPVLRYAGYGGQPA